jgi:branched-chain amino acid transport system substrate-binding protein
LDKRIRPARRALARLPLAAALVAGFGPRIVSAAGKPYRIGELNSYNRMPAFLEPYRKAMDLAIEEINAAGGIDGRPLEIIVRDDNGVPGDAVRVASELVSRERVDILAGGFLSNVGLALADFARQHRRVYVAGEPLTDKLVWENGNRYTFRLRASTWMQVAMLVPGAVATGAKRWALVYPNYEYGQSAAETFKTLMREQVPDVEFVAEQAPPLGKVDAGSVVQALADSRPEAIFNVLFSVDLAKFVREGNTRGLFRDRKVVSLLTGEPEYLDTLGEETPEGWLVTGYPWYGIDTPEHSAFLAAYRRRYDDYPRLGSVVGYALIQAIAAGLRRAGSADTEKLVQAFRGLEFSSPFGPARIREIDHQSTLGAFVGYTTKRDGRGVMRDYRYVDGASVQPPDEVVARLRPADR